MTSRSIFALGALALSACYQPAAYVDPGCRCIGTLPSGARVEIACGERICAGEIGYACVGVNTLAVDDSACGASGDAGADGPADDAGPPTIRITDAGPMALPDAGPARVDAGAPVDECTEELFEASWPTAWPTLCAGTTRTCALGCGTDLECAFSCVDADTTPTYIADIGSQLECGDCVYSQREYCYRAAGCADEFHAFYCCMDEHCAPGDGNCAQTECGNEVLAASACAPPYCEELSDPIYDVCFP